jgi:hypothetical protein
MYTKYIPGIYHVKTFWGLQRCFSRSAFSISARDLKSSVRRLSMSLQASCSKSFQWSSVRETIPLLPKIRFLALSPVPALKAADKASLSVAQPISAKWVSEIFDRGAGGDRDDQLLPQAPDRLWQAPHGRRHSKPLERGHPT